LKYKNQALKYKIQALKYKNQTLNFRIDAEEIIYISTARKL
jgi:hypothetical protein